MTVIAPFQGLRFNTGKIDDLSQVISPPYDKIDQTLRQELWQRDERNIVRLILPPPSGKDVDVVTQSTADEAGDWYGQAAERYQRWREEAILCVDESPSLYVYRQTFSYRGTSWTRTGLYVALQLSGPSGPHAHERTFEGPKADRLRLMQAMKTNPSPIFLLGDGSKEDWERVFSQTDTLLAKFKDEDGQEHELLSIANEKTLQSAVEFVNQRTLVIADGHHRYETAMNYCREMQEATGKDPRSEPWGSVLAAIVPTCNPGLLVLPTHRVIRNLPDGWMGRLLDKAQSYCSVTPIDDPTGETVRSQFPQDGWDRSVVAMSRDRAVLLTLNPSTDVPSLRGVPEPIRHLNVSVLHHFLLDDCLGLSQETLQETTQYIRGEDEALSLVRSGKADAAFLMCGIPPETVFNLSLENVRMPPKSTDFYPKIPTGLVLRSVEDSGQ